MTGGSDRAVFSWLRALLPGSVLTFAVMVSAFGGLIPPDRPVVFLLVALGWLAGIAWAGRRINTDSSAAVVPGRSGDVAELKNTGLLLRQWMSSDIAATREQLQASRRIVLQAAATLTAGFEKLTAGTQSEKMRGLENQDGFPGAFGDVVCGLQFEDLVIQAMATADDKLQSLQRVESLLDRLLQLWPETDTEAFVELKREIETRSAAAGGAPPPVIAVSSLSSSDVELF